LLVKNTNKDNKKALRSYIVVETIGITLLLLPTGGILSPFIWYALNPVLVAASFLPLMFSWINLFFYIFSASLISYRIFNDERVTFFRLIRNNSNIVLVLLLINLVVEMLSVLTKHLNNKTKELEFKGKQLEKANKMLKESKARLEDNLENIMSLYQVVEAFCNKDNLEDFLTAFTDCAVKLTKTKSAFFWTAPDENKNSIITVNNIEISVSELKEKVEELWNTSNNAIELIRRKIVGNDFLIVGVKSQARCFGLIGIDIENSNFQQNEKEYIQKLDFLAELSAVVLERFHFEEVVNNLLVTEEQNRIANEIHDSVSQRIFSITCAMHSIKSRWRSMTEEQIEEEFELINKASKNAMRELRLAIYGLSYKKRGEKVFEANIKDYLSDISRLNNIVMEFNLEGDADSLPGELKKALHRIIHEAAGNAVRHGNSKRVTIDFKVTDNLLELIVTDDGVGFQADKVNDNGLGIHNMKRMIQGFSGKLELISEAGRGTRIYIIIPICKEINKGEGVALENCNC
jgi:signal transduction histidine kinase